MKPTRLWLIAFVGLLAVPACSRNEERPAGDGKPIVVVSILPQAYFVERIAGDRVDVEVLVGPGQSPHTYEPTSKQMVRLGEAKAFFRIGVACEEIAVARLKSTRPDLLVIDTRQGIPLRRADENDMCEHDHGDEAHGHECEHAKGEADPHIWLAPALIKTQASTICEALCRLDPAGEDVYRRNLAVFHAELDRLDAELRAALAPLKGREFFVYHPAYGYFADAYGLRQVAVETAGREPGPKQLVALIERARRAGVKLIFVQPQFPVASANVLAAEIGGAVVPMDDLARDCLANLRDMAAKIQSALGTASQPTVASPGSG